MDKVGRYLKGAPGAVEGWLEPFSARYIVELARCQAEHGVGGPVAEIGVHHGRLFILMHLAAASRRDIAIDVFGDQHLNTDSSGKGNLARFTKNLGRWGGDIAKVAVLRKSSLEVAPAEVLEAVGPVALFSVDGGHTAECAENDLRLAEATIRPEGVVILDDYFNEFWPEVSEGTNRYLADPATRLRPFALTNGKMYLATPEQGEFYRAQMRKRFGPRFFDKEVSLFGAPVQLYGMIHQKADRARRLRWAIKDNPMGAGLLKALGLAR